MNNLVELENLHLKFSNESSTSWYVKGKYQYFHYKCDGFNDVGWGCGYRTLQTICSWIREQMIAESPDKTDRIAKPPSILDIQKILVKSGDKHADFVGSREWIGCFEAMIVIDTLYDVPCRILHCEAGCDLQEKLASVKEYLIANDGPIMMGGDVDAASKGVFGFKLNSKGAFSHLLIGDPHFVAKSHSIDLDYLLENKWIAWQEIDSFDPNSFYNFCIPQRKTCTFV